MVSAGACLSGLQNLRRSELDGEDDGADDSQAVLAVVREAFSRQGGPQVRGGRDIHQPLVIGSLD